MFTLVPIQFFHPEDCSRILSEIGTVAKGDVVKYVGVPQYGAALIYSVSGGDESLPEIFYVLKNLQNCSEYNKILCYWKEGMLYLGIAQGKTLLLANCFCAPHFTTVEYFIFYALKSLQLNPEVSTVHFIGKCSQEDEMSLYRYFKAVKFLESVRLLESCG